jgi:hypothetical protein
MALLLRRYPLCFMTYCLHKVYFHVEIQLFVTAKFEQDPEWFGSLDPGGSETLDLSTFILRLIKHDHDQRTTCRLWLHTYPNSL